MLEMPPFWKEKQVVKLRMRVRYWTDRLKEGRDDAQALELYAKYSSQLEELRAEHLAAKAKKKAEAADIKDVIKPSPEYVPSFTVVFE